VADWLGAEMDETLSRYRLVETLCYQSGSFDEPINWKTLTDAFLDAYHIATTHAGSVARYFYSNIQLYDPIGRHGRAISPRRSIDTLLDSPPETAPIEDHVTVGYSLMPNTVILRQPDHFQLLTFLPHPSGPERCRMEIRLLIPEPADTDTQRALWDKNWKILMAVLRDEDMAINRDLQMAMGNTHAPRSLVVGRNEIVNQRFHAWLDEMLSPSSSGESGGGDAAP
jgi:phenylpropionate dioxygenase-like ring-hydroxylating dioxygenase large terminal subunit